MILGNPRIKIKPIALHNSVVPMAKIASGLSYERIPIILAILHIYIFIYAYMYN